MSPDLKRNTVFFLLSFFMCVLLLLVYSYYTSPLSSEYGYDQAFFQMIGMGMHDGLVPYRDFHDMKGPYLFFMEWFGQLLCRGRFGCFLLQAICLIPSFFLIFKLMDLARAPSEDSLIKRCAIGLIACVPCLLVLAESLQGGNLPEELSLPFLMASMYCNIKYFVNLDRNNRSCYQKSWAFINGLCVCIIALIRVTNAAFILTTLLCVAIAILRRNGVNSFLHSLVWFMLGVVAAAVPAVIYCLVNDVLDEMVFLVFLFGFSYSEGMGFTGRLDEFFNHSEGALSSLMLWTLSPIISVALAHTRLVWAWGVALLGCIGTFLGVFVGHGYLHYAGIVVPLIAFAAFLLFYRHPGSEKAKYARRIVGVAAMVLITFVQAPYLDEATTIAREALYYHRNVSSQSYDYSAINDIASKIPAEDSDSVFCFGDTPWSRWYCMTGLYPKFRYCDYQRDHFAYDQRLEMELERDMENDPPLWLVTKGDVGVVSPFMERMISDKYELAYENETYTLYRLIAPSEGRSG